MELDISNKCRACLSTHTIMFPLFDIYEYDLTLADIIEHCLNTQLNPDINLPKEICEECVTCLIQFYNFSLIFEENSKKLTNFIENNSDKLNCEDSIIEEVDKSSDKSLDRTNKNEGPLCDTLDFNEDFAENDSYEEIIIKTIKEDDLNESKLCIDNDQYICEICGYITQKKSYLRDHMDTHSLNKAYKCNFCNKSFRGRSNFYRHRKIHIPKHKRRSALMIKPHVILENGEVKCDECNQTFKNLVQFKIHVKRHKKYVCEVCGYATYRQSYLTDHKEVHSLAKTYTCVVCNKSYRGRTNYSRHKRIHLNPKQINCDLCGQKFTTKGTLKTHIMLIHIKSKNFECIICNKKFSLKGTLMKHLRRHQQKEGVIAKDFKCIECNVEYYDKGSLKRHYSEKHNNEFTKFKCQYCFKEYVSKGNLSKHLKVYHKCFT
ncbi:finger putative transcription factor family-related [Holotrichia oblita]|uniref:Finger putative transcription factor family-related n=1 Tax=Holotrichia oblita TaxID=644536 RepID=A0ACB9T1Y2_HOLOL|nr:finger putative transcription factor family-related [Holotrichia oblita]